MAYPSNRPDKQPIVKTPVTDGQYASFVDRVIACREAEDRAKEDTKALYAEIAAAGEDKTYIGLVVRGLRLSNKERVKAEIRDAAVEEGRARYRRGKASHVRAREGSSESTTPNTSNSGADSAKSTPSVTTPDITGFSRDLPDHDPLTGVIIEDNEPAPASKEAVAAAGGEGVALPADTQSTGQDEARSESSDALKSQAPPVDTLPIRRDDLADAAVDGPQTVDGRHIPEPGDGQSGVRPASAGAPAAGEAVHARTSPAVPTNVTTFTRKPHDGPVSSKGLPRHKLCLHVDLCGGTWREACHDCRKAAAQQMAVEAGGVQIPHRGEVA